MHFRIKVFFRYFFKNKRTTITAIGALSISIFACYLITKFVAYELSYDQYNERASSIYRVITKKSLNSSPVSYSASTYSAVGPAIKDIAPEVEDFFRLKTHNGVISFEEKNISQGGMYFSDPSILNILTIRMIEGRKEDAFFTPYSSIISESTAKKLFGNGNPLGKSFLLDGKWRFTVDGVFEDLPGNSHLNIKVLLAYDALTDLAGTDSNGWSWNQFYTYLLLNKDSDVNAVEVKLASLTERFILPITNTRSDISLQLQALSDIHLKSHMVDELAENKDIYHLYFLILFGIVLFFLAMLNFVGLSTLKMISRAREIGIRKALGATGFNVGKQVLLESLLHNLFPVLLSILLISLIGKISLEYMEIPTIIIDEGWPVDVIYFVFVLVLINTISGVHPFLFSSKIKASAVLVNKMSLNLSTGYFRKGIIAFQFMASFILLVFSVTIYKQITYLRSQDLGINIEQTLVLSTPKLINYEVGSLNSRIGFKTELLRNPYIKSVAASSLLPGKPIYFTGKFSLRSSNEQRIFKVAYVDESFLDAFGLKLLAGSYYSRGSAINNGSVVINESAAKLLGLEIDERNINKVLIAEDKEYFIKGIIKDYHHLSLKEALAPIVYFYSDYMLSNIFIKVDPSDLKTKLQTIRQKWEEFFPGNPFEYFFLDDHFAHQYNEDRQLGKLTVIFSALAVSFTVIGIASLASVLITQRNKEVGIRKVMGASIISLWYVLIKDFVKLVLIAIVIGTPLVYILLRLWLEDFAYRTSIDFTFLLFPALFLVAIAVLAIGQYVIKSSKVNPVDYIRN